MATAAPTPISPTPATTRAEPLSEPDDAVPTTANDVVTGIGEVVSTTVTSEGRVSTPPLPIPSESTIRHCVTAPVSHRYNARAVMIRLVACPCSSRRVADARELS